MSLVEKLDKGIILKERIEQLREGISDAEKRINNKKWYDLECLKRIQKPKYSGFLMLGLPILLAIFIKNYKFFSQEQSNIEYVPSDFIPALTREPISMFLLIVTQSILGIIIYIIPCIIMCFVFYLLYRWGYIIKRKIYIHSYQNKLAIEAIEKEISILQQQIDAKISEIHDIENDLKMMDIPYEEDISSLEAMKYYINIGVASDMKEAFWELRKEQGIYYQQEVIRSNEEAAWAAEEAAEAIIESNEETARIATEAAERIEEVERRSANRSR
ncbi:TPA: hypothetical protein QCP59_003441 [Bacillus cereus]|nr:hypothetical protein [Bacillus cereus]